MNLLIATRAERREGLSPESLPLCLGAPSHPKAALRPIGQAHTGNMFMRGDMINPLTEGQRFISLAELHDLVYQIRDRDKPD